MDGVGEFLDVIRVVLNYYRRHIETLNKRLVLSPPDCVGKKIGGRLLFKAQAVANAVAGVNQQTDA